MRAMIVALSILMLSGQTTTPSPPPQPETGCPEMAAALRQLMGNDARLRDWPALARYREANRTLSAPKPGEARVVFMLKMFREKGAK